MFQNNKHIQYTSLDKWHQVNVKNGLKLQSSMLNIDVEQDVYGLREVTVGLKLHDFKSIHYMIFNLKTNRFFDIITSVAKSSLLLQNLRVCSIKHEISSQGMISAVVVLRGNDWTFGKDKKIIEKEKVIFS